MILYHTIRLTDLGGNRTIIFDLDTRETDSRREDVYMVIDEFNKKGYYLTAVQGKFYYLTKRVD